jgi:tetratricopeptide (TPR) repeat protein
VRPFAPRFARCLLGLVLACLSGLFAPSLAWADTGAAELAAGIASRTASPPDLSSARAHFERAAGDSDDRTAAEALYFLAEMDDLQLQFQSALERYRASAERLASSRYTPRANNRANELRGHAEGGFAPLVQLETIRRSPALANDATSIDGLVRDAATFPPGKVRVEARMLAAEAYLGRLGRRDDALPLLRMVVEDPKAELLTARAAASELVQTYVAKKDLPAALEVAQRFPKLLPPGSERTIVRLMRRRPLRILSILDLAVVAVFAAIGFLGPGRARAVRAVRELAPTALVFAAVACGVAGFLASRYEQTSPYPFTAMFPVTFVIAVLARAWGAAGSPAPRARALRAAASFVGVFAAAFLLLDHMDPTYLQGFGL